jgi:uncharacterized protein YlxW (UPF0749 family)
LSVDFRITGFLYAIVVQKSTEFNLWPNKLLSKSQIFGMPSIETARAIDDVDQVTRCQAAQYRLQARMGALESQFEEKATELRKAFLTEIEEITGERDGT